MKSPNFKSQVPVTLLLVGLAACNKADFNSDSKTKVTPEAATLACNPDRKYEAEDLRVGVRGDKSARILVNGEFCPQAPARLNIAFLIDFSLSMYNEKEERGNDQVKNKTCGRLEAARAIIESHRDHADSEDAKISVSVVQFASGIEGTIKPTAIEDFSGELTTDNFCRGTTGTNYKAAFEEVTEMLADVSGNKVVYLISDGMPTEGGGGARENAPRHRDAAQTAADDMRKNLKLLTYNTVYLGNIHEIDEENFDPEKFLVDLTGSKERVKLVEKAEDLAAEILKLEKPAVDIDTSRVTATLTADGIDPVEVGIALFAPHATKSETWKFSTEEFNVFPGAGSASRLQISAPDKNGETYQLSLKFEPGNETEPLDEAYQESP